MLRYLQHPVTLFSKKPGEDDGDQAPKGFEKFFKNRNDRKKADESAQKSEDGDDEKSTAEKQEEEKKED